MGLPADKTTRSKKGKRRSHDFLVSPGISICAQCRAPMRPHRVCKECGTYRGKEIVTPKN